MRVDTHDRRIAARSDRGVESDGNVRRGIVDQPDTLVLLRQALSELRRAVVRRPQREDELGGDIDVLGEHGFDRVLEVGALVEHRHHEGHPGQGSGCFVGWHMTIMSRWLLLI